MSLRLPDRITTFYYALILHSSGENEAGRESSRRLPREYAKVWQQILPKELSSCPFNTELNPIYHLLALFEAHHILHVSRIRVNPISPSQRAKICPNLTAAQTNRPPPWYNPSLLFIIPEECDCVVRRNIYTAVTQDASALLKVKVKVHPCTGTEVLYRPYAP